MNNKFTNVYRNMSSMNSNMCGALSNAYRTRIIPEMQAIIIVVIVVASHNI